MDRGGSAGPHLVQRHGLSQSCRLPRRLTAGQTAADDVDHSDILTGPGRRAAADRSPPAAAGSVECGMRGVLPACAVVAALACGGNSTTGPSAVTPTEALELRWQSEHFRIFAGATPDAVVRATADRLESEFARILGALELSSVPGVTVRIWQDESTYAAELVRYFGVRYQATGYITGPSELRLLATAQLGQNAVHEFVHAASLAVNPSFANNPRWLWETVALYENGERNDPRQLDICAAAPSRPCSSSTPIRTPPRRSTTSASCSASS